MINAVTNILTSPALVNLSQNTTACVSYETIMKAVGRPSFILMDKDLKGETKKYAATKELLYQLICLCVYLTIIPTVFKRGLFALAKKTIYKEGKGFEKFKNSKDFLNFYELADMDKVERLKALKDSKIIEKFKDRPNLINELETVDNPANQYYLQKGVIEGGSLIGSILGLAILAPEISHKLIHPIMRGLGLEKKEEKENQTSQKRLDKKV